MTPRPTRSTLFPYTTLFRSQGDLQRGFVLRVANQQIGQAVGTCVHGAANWNAQILMPMAAKILEAGEQAGLDKDRKSTRLNSSHVRISYAVFCLKKKKKT